MAETPTSASALSMNVFVLLPAAAHVQRKAGPITPLRPPSLISRQSGSSVATLSKLRSEAPSTINTADIVKGEGIAPDEITDEPEAEMQDVVAVSRRLSLAPGMGGGTQTKPSFAPSFSPMSSTHPTSPKSAAPTSGPPPFGSGSKPAGTAAPPTFGSRPPVSARGGARKRPNTAAAGGEHNRFNVIARGSMALPSGMGIGMTGSKSRPGWEGDEVVGMLRSTGVEVTVIRSISQLSTILSVNGSPSLSSFGRIGAADNRAQATPVILVPLCDSPALPSLSLLLSQGTTPTAVCFQQDLLDRAKRTEEEWLPTALEQIRSVVQIRDSLTGDVRPIIIAYSANQALSNTTSSACIQVGASGVLKPPYDADTAKLLRRLTRAAMEGRVSAVMGLMHDADATADMSVVLPPVALDLGDGEHDTERALSTHRRKISGQWDSTSDLSQERRSSVDGRSSRRSSKHDTRLTGPMPATPMTAVPLAAGLTKAMQRMVETVIEEPSSSTRRRSVDIGGLNMAMSKAEQVFAAPTPLPLSPGTPIPPPPRSAGVKSGSHETHLAELLGTMFHQSCQTIEVQMDEFASMSGPMSQSDRHRLIDELSTWGFKPHRLSDKDLYLIASLIFEAVSRIEGVAELKLKPERLNRLLFAIRAIYHAPNPYHNYVHAIDVLQATYTFLMDIGVLPPWEFLRETGTTWSRPDENAAPVHGLGTRRAREILRPQDVLAIIVAAMGHDVGHPGLSNAFMKNARTPLSEVYDDKSVLENMHCMLVLQLLRKHGLSFLFCPTAARKESNPARRQFDSKGFRHVLYSAVLATDMSLHFAWITQLKAFGERIEKGEVASHDKIEEQEKERVLVCQALIKCADISNPTRPIDVSEHWSSVLLEEWAKQASLETDLELPVSVIASADEALQAKGQIGFIDLFTQPLFEAVSDVLPELQQYADSCADNRNTWAGRLEALQASGDTAIVQPPIMAASTDDRFKTLFPLSLPASLIAPFANLPEPISVSRSANTRALSSSASASPARSTFSLAPSSSRSVQSHSTLTSTYLKTPDTAQSMPSSATTLRAGDAGADARDSETAMVKAIRAVYHVDVLEYPHRTSLAQYGYERRASTPDGLTVNVHDHGRFAQRFLV